MHCSVCQIDFNTLSAYVKHHRDLHSHSRNFCLICSCGGSFSTLRSQTNQEESSDLDFRVEPIDQDNENLENESIDSTNETESLNEEEQLKIFQKRVLYLLLTLQSVFYTSEAAINFVVGSLAELFLAISTNLSEYSQT